MGLTKGLARELAPQGITINNVQPGPVDTDSNSADGPAAPLMLNAMALDRFGDVSEIGAFVSFLAGPDGGFVTGASLSIDGGFTSKSTSSRLLPARRPDRRRASAHDRCWSHPSPGHRNHLG